MATHTTQTAVGEREDLADVIYRIDPDETPIFSALKKETSNGIFTEWQVQELAAASATNYVNEGANATFATPTATTRFGTRQQTEIDPGSEQSRSRAARRNRRPQGVPYSTTGQLYGLRGESEIGLH